MNWRPKEENPKGPKAKGDMFKKVNFEIKNEVKMWESLL